MDVQSEGHKIHFSYLNLSFIIYNIEVIGWNEHKSFM